MRRAGLPVLIMVVLGACAAPPPPPPPPPSPPPPPPPAVVWTAREGVTLRADSADTRIPHLLTRLRVLGADSLGLLVSCGTCPDSARGRVAAGDVLAEAGAPIAAVHGSLAAFALAVREAAARRDLVALRLVMAPDFTFAWIGLDGPDAALSSWRSEGFQTLEQVPALLDRGLAPLPDSIWVAPPEFQRDPGYQGLRIGFRRSAARRWEWVFLVRGEGR